MQVRIVQIPRVCPRCRTKLVTNDIGVVSCWSCGFMLNEPVVPARPADWPPRVQLRERGKVEKDWGNDE